MYTYNVGKIACARTNEEYISFSALRVVVTPHRSPAFRVKANVTNRNDGACSPLTRARVLVSRERSVMHGSEDATLGRTDAEGARRRLFAPAFV